jgi:hypothetical protein
VQNIVLETREKRAGTEDAIGRVLKDLKEDPHLSLRQRETKLGIHRSTLSRIITEQGFHPYRPSLLLDLQQSHKDNRVAMCKMFLDKLDSEPSFMDNMWFSDECRFSLDRVVNKKDCVYYASTNPHWTIDVSHSYQSSHVWCALSKKGIIGPYFFRTTVTALAYIEMLDKWFLDRMFSFHPDYDVWFQQDSAPAHMASITCSFLNLQLPHRWIGKGSDFPWSPKSPDLTPTDFFLWGYLKSLVYEDNPKTIADLEDAITAAIHAVPQQYCINAVEAVPKRMRECLHNEGNQINSK